MSKEAPKYICWYENDFMADRAVMRMTPHQRLMYRGLCQVARYCETRPYLPDDDNELYLLADADNLKQWKENREAILVKFSQVTIDDKPMLAQKRILQEAGEYEGWLEQKREAGKNSARARAQRESTTVERPLNARPTSSVESNAVLSVLNPLPVLQNRHNSNGDHNSQNSVPQNSELVESSVDPMDQSVTDILNEFGCPVMLAWLFDRYLQQTNPRRVRLGKKAADPKPNHWKKTWASDFQRLLDAGYTSEQLQTMMKFVFESDRWLVWMWRPKNFVDNHDKIAGDLHIRIREVAPEMTAAEKLQRHAKAQTERDDEEWDQHLDKIMEENNAHECLGGCGKTVSNNVTYCDNCASEQLGNIEET